MELNRGPPPVFPSVVRTATPKLPMFQSPGPMVMLHYVVDEIGLLEASLKVEIILDLWHLKLDATTRVLSQFKDVLQSHRTSYILF